MLRPKKVAATKNVNDVCKRRLTEIWLFRWTAPLWVDGSTRTYFWRAQPEAPATARPAGASGWALNNCGTTVCDSNNALKWRCPIRRWQESPALPKLSQTSLTINLTKKPMNLQIYPMGADTYFYLPFFGELHAVIYSTQAHIYLDEKTEPISLEFYGKMVGQKIRVWDTGLHVDDSVRIPGLRSGGAQVGTPGGAYLVQ